MAYNGGGYGGGGGGGYGGGGGGYGGGGGGGYGGDGGYGAGGGGGGGYGGGGGGYGGGGGGGGYGGGGGGGGYGGGGGGGAYGGGGGGGGYGGGGGGGYSAPAPAPAPAYGGGGGGGGGYGGPPGGGFSAVGGTPEPTLTEKLSNYMVNNGSKIGFLIVFWGLNFFFFFRTYTKYRRADVYEILGEGVTFARGAAAALNFNCGLILFPLCRNIMTFLRTTFVHHLVPLDMNVRFHKTLAWMIAAMVFTHGTSHYFNFYNLSQTIRNTETATEIAYFTLPGSTGHLITLVMIILYTSALKRLRNHCFELFWYAHHLFIIFFGALLVHGADGLLQPPQFFLWFAGPGLFYMCERGLRIIRANQVTTIDRIIQHPSEVVELRLNKASFKYKTGQYLFVNCQKIAKYEWHPITITSCPEEEYVSIHVRIVGDWTKALVKILGLEWDKAGHPIEKGTIGVPPDLTFRLDGGFGAASEDVFDYPVVMLVGAGIGVTPFASILKSVWYRIADVGRMKLQHVYFVWSCRNKEAFEWFADLLAALEAENLGNFLDIRVYLTAKLKIQDVKEIMYMEEEGADDCITGLQAPTYYGRPNFEAIYQELAQNHPDTNIGVFLCGPKAISGILRRLAGKYTDTRKGGVRFHFEKENF